jgi:TatA/E family protein of Tat protein translocase
MFRNPTTDLIVVLVIVLLIFGPKRLPGLGKQLGQGLREFKDSITGDSKSSDDEQRPARRPRGGNRATGAGGQRVSAGRRLRHVGTRIS